MSLFYGTLRGSARTAATQRGSANSGLVVECNTRDFGITVAARKTSDGRLVFDVLKTGGSNGAKKKHLVRVVTVMPDGEIQDSYFPSE
jgi:hypothetical protein